MNAKQLEEIRERDDKKLIRSSVPDRSALLAEVERLYRSNERMDKQVRQVRALATVMEDDTILDESDWFAARLRAIVGPR